MTECVVPLMTIDQESCLSKLRVLADAGASGAFVAFDGDKEMHVFLQSGAIAWAVRSDMQRVFLNRLMTTSGVEQDTLLTLFRECRKNKTPLRTTLIERRLATDEQVRDALQHQVQGALSKLGEYPLENSKFLHHEAAYADYDSRLTFELDEVLTDNPTCASAPPAEVKVESSADQQAFVSSLADSIPSASWVRLVHNGQVASSPANDSLIAKAKLNKIASLMMETEADFVSLGSDKGNIFGFALEKTNRSLWCGFEAGVDSASGLWTLNSRISHSLRPPIQQASKLGAVIAKSNQRSSVLDNIEGVVSQAKRLGAVLVSERGESRYVHRSAKDLDVLKSLATLGGSLLLASLPPAVRSGRSPTGASVVLGLKSRWVLGTIPLAAPDATLWITVDRAAPRAVAWALLSALEACL